MSRSSAFWLSLLACLAIAPARAASVSTIDFDDLTLADGAVLVPTNYGSNLANTPYITVGYESWDLSDIATEPSDHHLLFWNDGHGDLSKVAYSTAENGLAVIKLEAAAGYKVELRSFMLAARGGSDLAAGVLRVLDGDGIPVWGMPNTLVDGTARTEIQFSPNLTASTLVIQWGTNNRIGIDNIVFAQVSDAPAAVPEPAGLAMLALGGAATGLIAMRRKRA